MAISFDDLPEEVWNHILEFLTPSLPKPLSGWSKVEAVGDPEEVKARLPDVGEAGVTTRKDIRASELAVLMRTSIAFNDLASAPLYKMVITDQFAKFLKHLNAPAAHPRLKSKRQLLARTISLHLEYSQKCVDPTYFDIFTDREELWVIGAISDIEMAAIQACGETIYLQESLTSLGKTAPFPKLHTVTIASIFGPQRDLWARVADGETRDPAIQLRATRLAMEGLLQTAPLKHMCQRGSYGPLSLPRVITWSNKPIRSPRTLTPPPLFTFHFDTRSPAIPIAPGHPTRWILEEDCRGQNLSEVLYAASGALDELVQLKELRACKKRLELEVFCSSDRYDDEDTPTPRAKETDDAFAANHDEERGWCKITNETMRDTWQDAKVGHRDNLELCATLAPMANHFDRLLPVWGNIVEHLAPPFPGSLAGWTKAEATGESGELIAVLPEAGAPGTVTRQDIRSPPLATLMRTSIAFNELASRPLYRRVMTDRLSDLLCDFGKPPAHPLIASKRELLLFTRAVQLEYSQKGSPPSYKELLRDSSQFLAVGCPTRETAMIQGMIELEQTHSTLVSLDGARPFPNLHTVTLCAIFGQQDRTWDDLLSYEPTYRSALASTTLALERVLQPIPLTRFCQRAGPGPLSLPHFATWSGASSHPTPLLNIHFDTRTEHIPVGLGHPTRWIMETHERRQSVQQICEAVSESMDYTALERKAVLALKRNVELELCCSTDRFDSALSPMMEGETGIVVLSPNDERRWSDMMGPSTRKAWANPLLKQEEDKLSWTAWIDSEPCLACGWARLESREGDRPEGEEVISDEGGEGAVGSSDEDQSLEPVSEPAEGEGAAG